MTTLGVEEYRSQEMYEQVEALILKHMQEKQAKNESSTMVECFECVVNIPQTIPEAMLVASMVESIVAMGMANAQTH